jgi:hypothetical protein
VSVLPILFRVLPPLVRDAQTSERHPDHAVTIGGLVAYIAFVAAIVALIND